MAKTKTRVRNEEFGLEDLSSGIFGGNKHKSAKGYEGLLDAGLGFILTDPTTSAEAYAMEAMNCLGESNQFGMYVTNSIEALDHMIGTLTKVKSKYGIESLKPFAYSMEAVDIKAFFKKMWDAIVVAFKRLVQAVANFIRSAMNTIGSMAFGRQSKYYEANKDKIAKEISDNGGKYKFKGLVPVSNPDNIIKAISDGTAKVNAICATQMKAIEQYMSRDKVEKFEDAENGAKKIYESLTAGLGKAISAHASDIKTFNPKKAIYTAIFGTEKPKASDVTVQQFFKNIDVSILSSASAARMKGMVTSTKLLLKGMNQGIMSCVKMSKQAEKFVGASSDKADKKGNVKGAKEVRVAVYNTSTIRLGYSKSVAMVLHTYSSYIKIRSMAYKACKLMVKGKTSKEEDK